MLIEKVEVEAAPTKPGALQKGNFKVTYYLFLAVADITIDVQPPTERNLVEFKKNPR